MPHLIAVDWGTSSLRGARLDEAGQVLEEKSAPLGILNVPNGDFAGVFASLFVGLDEAGRHALPDLRHGRQPAGLGRGALCRLSRRARRARAAPALDRARPDRHRARPQRYAGRCARRDARRGGADLRRDAAGRPRGRPVRPARHAQQMGHGARRPGHGLSHLHDRRGLWPVRASTPSWRARSTPTRRSTRRPSGAALRGPATAKACCTTPSASGRSALFGRLSPAESASYLSGLLIGEELGRQTLPESGEVIVIGASALVERYALALGARGAKVRTFGAEATWAGLRALQR